MAEGKTEEVKMALRPLGRSGLMVSELGMGCMTFSTRDEAGLDSHWGGFPVASMAESHAMLDRFASLGGNFIDTANCYGNGDSEACVGHWLSGKDRGQFVVATKVGSKVGPAFSDKGLGRVSILKQVESSLSRLQTDYIDLYQCHLFDNNTPMKETLTTLNDLVRAGKVRHIGFSNFNGWQIAKAQEMCRAMGLEQAISLQPQYSLLARGIEYDMLDCCQEYDMGVIPWSALGGGLLTGRYRRGISEPPAGSRVEWATKVGWSQTSADKFSDTTFDIIEKVVEIAEKHGRPPAQVALRWIGSKSIKNIEDNLQALSLELSEEDMTALDVVSAVAAPYPYAMSWNTPKRFKD